MCEKCNKEYSSYQSLWNHNKKFHNKLCLPKKKACLPEKESLNKLFICNLCKKEYDNRNSKYKHQKKCAENTNSIKQLEIKFTSEIDKLKSEINKKSNKKTINNTNNGTIINNNITINKIGTENLALLNDNEISQIFNKELESIITFIELLNFNERLLLFLGKYNFPKNKDWVVG